MNLQHTELISETALVSLIKSSISWAQLERGTLDVGYRVVPAGPLVVSSRSVSLACRVRGKMERGRRVAAVIETHRPGTRWMGHEVDSATLAVGRTELDLLTTGPSRALAIAVDENELHSRFSDSQDASDIMEGLDREGVSRSLASTGPLRRAIRLACSMAVPPPTIAGTLIPLLATTVKSFNGYSVERTPTTKRRFAAVRACEHYMRENLTSSVTILDLSRFCGMRSRSLINAFEAITGLSPMDYLKRLRLSEVRRALLRADRSKTRIIAVAMDWGFWHMGHFAKDYRAMFGEAPSQTLLG